MNKRHIKLGALTMGCGGPGRHNLWLDPELPADASVNIDWYIDIARQGEGGAIWPRSGTIAGAAWRRDLCR
jgi:hypothetical protein